MNRLESQAVLVNRLDSERRADAAHESERCTGIARDCSLARELKSHSARVCSDNKFVQTINSAISFFIFEVTDNKLLSDYFKHTAFPLQSAISGLRTPDAGTASFRTQTSYLNSHKGYGCLTIV